MTHYFLCRNPLGVSPIGVEDYIFSSKKPRFFAGILELDPESAIPDMDYEGSNLLFSYTTATEVKKYFMLIVTQNIDRLGDQKLKLELREAAKYYVHCLIHEDRKQHGKVGGWYIMEQYNPYLPMVQLLQNKKHGNFLLGYHDGVKTLSSFEEVKKYMREVLEYDERIVKGGTLNTY
jgi:hypothetical protein